MPLSRRLALMLGALLFISLLGAAATQFLLVQARGSFTGSQGAAERLARVLQLEIDLASARNQIDIWLQRANPAQVRAAGGFLARLDDEAAQLAGEAALTPQQRAQLEAFEAARAEYLRSWRHMQEIVALRMAAEAAQNREGNALFRSFAALPPGEAQAPERLAATAQVAALQYRAEPTAERRAAAMAATEAAAAALRQAGFGPATPVGASFAAWMAAQQQAMRQSQRFAQMLADLRAQGDALSAAILELRSMETAQAQAAATQARGSLTTTSRVALLASALVILGWVACILALIRAIVPPLQGINTATGAIARGDLRASIPGLARRDELGAMARSLDLLRDGLVKKAAGEMLNSMGETQGRVPRASEGQVAAPAQGAERAGDILNHLPVGASRTNLLTLTPPPRRRGRVSRARASWWSRAR